VKELTYAVVFLAGVLIAVQAAINSRLGQALGNGMHAVLVSFVIGTVGAVLYCLIEGRPVASSEAVKGGPWWMWTGGLLGVAFVWSTIFAVPKIGVAVTFPLVVAGQMAASIVMEHFGLLGSPTQPVTWARVGGVLLVVLGVVVLGLTRGPRPDG
jgi:bacterial/archaeal transporter family-2 protein